MNQSDSRDSVGQSADDVLKTSKHHDDLRTRIAAALDGHVAGWYYDCCPEGEKHVGEWSQHVADAVIRELDLGIPCAANGCTMRRIARYHAEKSSKLESYE